MDERAAMWKEDSKMMAQKREEEYIRSMAATYEHQQRIYAYKNLEMVRYPIGAAPGTPFCGQVPTSGLL